MTLIVSFGTTKRRDAKSCVSSLLSSLYPPPSHVTATGGMGKRLGKTLPLKVGQVQDHVLKKRNYLLVD